MKVRFSHTLVMSVAMVLLAACSDYDNGFTEKDLKYAQDFKALYGDIDAEQDWNVASRQSVTVTTDRTSEIKVYALVDGEYALVGDFNGVQSTQTLVFDTREDVQTIMVSDGRTAVKTVVGGEANFSGSRTTYEGTSGLVTVTKITSEAGVDIGGVNYPKYIYATDADYNAMVDIIPEIGHRDTYTNLNRVTHDFSYVSTGSFVIYPYYWNTSSNNTLGIYYYDQTGRHEVDIYKCKEGDELMYENVTNESLSSSYAEDLSAYEGLKWSSQKTPVEGWSIDNGQGAAAFHYNGWSTEADPSGMKTPFIEYWHSAGNTLEAGAITKTFTGVEPGSYAVYIDARVMNENSLAAPQGFTFFANDGELDLCKDGSQATYTVYDQNGNVSQQSAEVYYNNLYVTCTVQTDGVLTLGFRMNNVVGNWLAFKNLRIIKRGAWASTADKNSFGKVRRGQGIRIDIPEGTKFGMYLKAATSSASSQFYSESALNLPAVCGSGVTDDGLGTATSVTQVEGLHPCYAATFNVTTTTGEQQLFLGFEDWPNTANESDFDLNDLVLAFSGCTPTIINEDPTPAASWILACEDLGGSFDTDYNDIVLKVEHVSGQEFATITPLAAGGTLASYIFFEDPTTTADEVCLGEIHQLFGQEPRLSGEYTPTNVGSSRGSAGSSVTVPVGKDWSMAYYTSDNFKPGNQYTRNGNSINMGGFGIYVLPEGHQSLQGNVYSTNSAFGQASIIAAPGLGEAPMMLCIPYTYTRGEYTYVWAWPRELYTISDGGSGGAYPKFAAWIADHSKEGEWYKYPYANTVSELKWLTTTATEEEADPTPAEDTRATPTIGGTPSIGWVSTGTAVSGNQTFVVPTGLNLWMKMQLNGSDYSGAGTWSATISDGGTGSTLDMWYGREINVTAAGTTPGTAKVTVSFSGDANYKPASVTYTIEVAKQVTLYARANATDYGLTISDGKLKMIGYNTGDANQYWYLVNPINEKGGSVESGTFWLYNKGTGQYVTFNNDSRAVELTTAMPIGAKSARIHSTDGKLWNSRHGSTYLFGIVNYGDASVGLLKDNAANAGSIITFEERIP